MIFAWTNALIHDSLAGLTDRQVAALDLSVVACGGNPGVVRLGRFGFQNVEEYRAILKTARARVRDFGNNLAMLFSHLARIPPRQPRISVLN